LSKFVWIKNNLNQGVRAIVQLKTDDGSKRELKIEFSRLRTDKDSGRLMSNGYTRITDEEYDQLMDGSKIFKSFIDKKSFVKYDLPPADAFTDAQRIMQLEADKGALQAQIDAFASDKASLQAQVASYAMQLRDLQAQVDAAASDKTSVDSGSEKQEFAGDEGTPDFSKG